MADGFGGPKTKISKEEMAELFNQKSDIDLLKDYVSKKLSAPEQEPEKVKYIDSGRPLLPPVDPSMGQPFIGVPGGSEALKQLRDTDPRERRQKFENLMLLLKQGKLGK